MKSLHVIFVEYALQQITDYWFLSNTQSLADNCFPTSQGHSASRLHGMPSAI